ncbi:tetratricopeptide repeat protein [Ruegeria marina]|uniref:TPR repeat-containing protein n=1 Tax=Ruegeria marina TaxID=639004 RepID=A0A1G6TWL3_9RHOB|nr:tetratricopeptide repeat protein [Ruegeria marina]SDD33304.1 TPR repeat-containing protein [Ruegeria marina]
MKNALLALLLPLSPGLLWASECPEAPDHSAQINRLIAEIRVAPNEGQARELSSRMWEFWADAPDEQAQAILDRGMSRRSSWDLLGALDDFNRLVAYCPDYAEGYNQRAFVNYLRQDFAAALVDLDRALELSPTHVAAMSGRALSLLGLSRIDEAREELQQALELNPWLPERGLVAPGGPLEPKGKDI